MRPAVPRLGGVGGVSLSATARLLQDAGWTLERAANLDTNRVLVAVLAVMGVPLVIIGMIGLLNSMTMNVIERTREVGILRCIGASSRTVRRIFRAEALAVANGS